MERVVRMGHTLNEAEKQHVTRRRLTVQQCLEKNSIHCPLDMVPNIALIGSGGGQRAMVGLLASVLELKKQGLLDCMMYLSGVSGSTWAMASLYKETNCSSKLESVTKEIVSRLSRGVWLWPPWALDIKWWTYKEKHENFNYTHWWSTLIVSMFVKEIGERVLSEQRGKHDKDPYPIYTVIDKEFKDQKETGLKEVWVEMTPHEAGYSLTGAFVDQKCFGSKFNNGTLIKEQPEMDMLYVQEVKTSLINPTWGITYNFLHNMTAEEAREEDPDVQNQGLQGLSKSETREYIDAGLLLNSPYFSVLRPEREVDLIISLDFSEGDPMMTIEDAHRMSKDMGIAFPHVEFTEDDRQKPKDFYVFPGDDNTPTVIHMPLFNRVNCPARAGDLEQMRENYKTIQLAFDAAKIKELMERAAANVSNTKRMLKEEICNAVNKRRMRLCLEALSAVTGCNVEQTTASSQLTPQDIVNIVALKEFYKQEGFQELEYPSLGTLSLRETDDMDLYSASPALKEGPSTAAPDARMRTTVKINPQDFFDPQYDYDFTNVKDGDKSFTRGSEQYVRPCGWRRVALRVAGKYGGGEAWLGTGSAAWPVSYHGNDMDGTPGIILPRQGSAAEEEPGILGASASLTTGDTRVRGVYSTPDVKMAEKYCKTFKSQADGNTYKVVLQNRINPAKRQRCQRDGYWVVYVPHDTDGAQTRAIVQESLRPYCMLLKQL